jgi:hypothetical protein
MKYPLFKTLFGLVLLLCMALAESSRGAEKISLIPQDQVIPLIHEWGRGDWCVLQRHNEMPAGIFGGYTAGMSNATYFDPGLPSAGCPTAGYPFQFDGVSYTLYDYGGVQWPVMMDIVVYDVAPGGGPCDGPGAELYRTSVSCFASVFSYPILGYIDFPTPFSVFRPFFVALEYTDTGPGPFPSIVMDDNPAPTVCDNWFRFLGAWYEWYDIWTSPGPGYPIFYVMGETNAGDQQLKRQVISAGGRKGNAGAYELVGTLGQTGVGIASVYRYLSVSSGFWGPFGGGEDFCDCIPGDANCDGVINVGDAVYLIDCTFRTCDPLCPHESCSRDANCDCTVNMGDIVFIVNYVFKGGPAPCDCTTWVDNCGMP